MLNTEESRYVAGYFCYSVEGDVLVVLWCQISISAGVMQFGEEELQRATSNFHKDRVIGEGAYGCLYLGTDLRGTVTSAAIKVLTQV